MNRRELLATGIGLGSVALTSNEASACGAEATKDARLDPGVYYCPQFPYMFCGSYTLYYAVQDDTTVTPDNCGANPASLAGPNGLACGCNAAGCQKTRLESEKTKEEKAREEAERRNRSGDPCVTHAALEKWGMKHQPHKKLAFSAGAKAIGLGGDLGNLVQFADENGKQRTARVFKVKITIADLDGELLNELKIKQTLINPTMVNDRTFYVGHEDLSDAAEPIDDAAAAGTKLGNRTYSVQAVINKVRATYTVVMMRNDPK